MFNVQKASGMALDAWGFMYGVKRKAHCFGLLKESDGAYRKRIRSCIVSAKRTALFVEFASGSALDALGAELGVAREACVRLESDATYRERVKVALLMRGEQHVG